MSVKIRFVVMFVIGWYFVSIQTASAQLFTAQQLPTGEYDSFYTSLNDRGLIAGVDSLRGPIVYDIVSGTTTYLAGLAGNNFFPGAINNNGLVIGQYIRDVKLVDLTAGAVTNLGPIRNGMFAITDSGLALFSEKVVDLTTGTTLAASNSSGLIRDLNESGIATIEGGGIGRLLNVRTGEVFTFGNTLRPGFQFAADKIGDDGFVAGAIFMPGTTKPFGYDPNTGLMIDISLPGFADGYSYSIDRVGVGHRVIYQLNGSSDGSLRDAVAAYWDPDHGAVKLDDVTTGLNGIHLVGANAINASGQILAWGEKDGAGFSFLLTPTASVPEPAVWLTMLVGFGFVGAGLRRSRISSAQLMS